jgi:hypothetical protein
LPPPPGVDSKRTMRFCQFAYLAGMLLASSPTLFGSLSLHHFLQNLASPSTLPGSLPLHRFLQNLAGGTSPILRECSNAGLLSRGHALS